MISKKRERGEGSERRREENGEKRELSQLIVTWRGVEELCKT